jgi:hypothetical protein
MIYADKENLKTRVAQEILLVREKEMKFYTRNLSMLGTHAALLAGFAFTILSQHQFMTPDEGFLSYESEVFLGMWPENSTHVGSHAMQMQKGMAAWPWHVWCHQMFQLLHLCFTAMGILLHLWTVYTTVVTNILGLHLALRGPEGSVDRAVRHMAQQNQFALRKFLYGLVLFNLSLLFFTLSEYHIFVSVITISCIITLSRATFLHIVELGNLFYLGEDDMITGQWLSLDARERGKPPNPATRKGPGPGSLHAMSHMVSGRYGPSAGGSAVKPQSFNVRDGLHTVAEKLRMKSKGRTGTRWASTIEVVGKPEEQEPSKVAERLIINQQIGQASQHPSPTLRRVRSRGRLRRQLSASFRASEHWGSRDGTPPKCNGSMTSPNGGASVALAQRQRAAATQLQSRMRGTLDRQRSRELAGARASARRDISPDMISPEESYASGGAGVGTGGASSGDGTSDLSSIVGNVMDRLGIGISFGTDAAQQQNGAVHRTPAERTPVRITRGEDATCATPVLSRIAMHSEAHDAATRSGQ